MRRKARPGGGRQAEVTVERLGGRGDGVAELDGRPVFVPLALPGERLRVRLTGAKAGGARAEIIELLEVSPERAEPPCRHFGPCGGCALQHLEAGRYGAWKQALAGEALAQRGLPGDGVVPLVAVPPGSRRRAVLAALRRGRQTLLGFHERASHRVVDVTDCLLLTPVLMALLPALRAVLAEVMTEGEQLDITVSETGSGPDLLVTAARTPDLAARQALAGFAEQADLARISWSAERDLPPEPIALRRPPRVAFAGVSVEPPPGGFLQPSAAGEAALRRLLLEALPESPGDLLELYAGCGSFTFDLAARARVHAVEGDEAAVAALWAAARRADLAGRIGVEARDLARQPFTPEELAPYGCVVFDPPRAGAREQAEALARSRVPALVALSCNPRSFARDARTLTDGGYVLTKVTPVDQFPWSAHLELVAQFRR